MNKIFKFILSKDFEPKRVCGILGFIVILFVIIWCTITATQAPLIFGTFIWAVSLLLGIDTIISPFKKNSNSNNT